MDEGCPVLVASINGLVVVVQPSGSATDNRDLHSQTFDHIIIGSPGSREFNGHIDIPGASFVQIVHIVLVDNQLDGMAPGKGSGLDLMPHPSVSYDGNIHIP